MKKFIAGLLMISLLGGCGWQLRGSSATTTSKLDSVYISSEDNHGPFVTQLLQSLRSDKIAVVDSSDKAALSLYLLDERHDRRTAAVGSDALTSAYELTIVVEYEIRTPAGQSVDAPTTNSPTINLPNTTSVTRTFNYSAGSATSGAREESLVLGEMRRELARALIRRLNAIAEQTVPAKPDTADHGQITP
jgi:LPS-assembly lipoprotein